MYTISMRNKEPPTLLHYYITTVEHMDKLLHTHYMYIIRKCNKEPTLLHYYFTTLLQSKQIQK